MVTVQVIWRQTDKPVHGSRVAVSVGNDGVYTEYTDSEGEAHFANFTPGQTEIYVDGKTVFTGRLEGKKTVYI